VQTGRDLGTLSKELQEHYGVTRRRAAYIARDQNNKATAAMTRARQTELGLDEAMWRHSGGGKHPRPTHLAMNGQRYKISEGMWDSAVNRFILPGEEPNCRCVSRAIIPGFS
jgi:SPP1 gp7 family putative phage head morphogenesis protein